MGEDEGKDTETTPTTTTKEENYNSNSSNKKKWKLTKPMQKYQVIKRYDPTTKGRIGKYNWKQQQQRRGYLPKLSSEGDNDSDSSALPNKLRYNKFRNELMKKKFNYSGNHSV